MPSVIVDGIEVEIGAKERLNGIQAAARAGVKIPHYCWQAGLSVVASCRMCLVEAGRKDPQTGQIQMQPKVVPACQTPASDGTIVVTSSDKVRNARAMVEEDLLLRHPVELLRPGVGGGEHERRHGEPGQGAFFELRDGP